MTGARVLFAGTPDFSVPSLQALHDSGVEVAGVWCQPDRPSGRGRATRMCPVKLRARELAIPVFQPATLRDPAAQKQIRDFDADLMVVTAYGLLLPQQVLDATRRGCVNVHASLLPRWRGAAPIQRAIEAGDPQTGITLMQMDAGLDTGPMLAIAAEPIAPDETGGSLHDRLARTGSELLSKNLRAILEGTLEDFPQDESAATYAAKIDKAEAELDWTRPAAQLERRIRAFNPWPVCHTPSPHGSLRIWMARVLPPGDNADAVAGTVIASGPEGIDVACGIGVLRLLELQRAGGRRMEAGRFLNGTPLPCGTLLE